MSWNFPGKCTREGRHFLLWGVAQGDVAKHLTMSMDSSSQLRIIWPLESTAKEAEKSYLINQGSKEAGVIKPKNLTQRRKQGKKEPLERAILKTTNKNSEKTQPLKAITSYL